MASMTLTAPTMFADHHVLKAREALLALSGIEDVYASSAWRAVIVIYDPSAIQPEAIEGQVAQAQGALAVEMEMSAVFTVAAFREMEAAGLLVVSDELSDYTWRPGFKTPGFNEAREKSCRAALTLAKGIATVTGT